MGHAGDISPEEAYALLEDDPEAVLVDVRTHAEWTYVGLPDLEDVDKEVVRIEWNTASGGHNDDFLTMLDDEGLDRDAPLLFLCRSGARSAAAAEAATAHGYTRAHNVSGGFEGPRDAAGHRGTHSGWKAAGLPWTQS